MAGAVILAVSLFLTWSHQLPRAERIDVSSAALYGVPADPDAFQVYAIVGEVLAVLAIVCAAAGLWGQRQTHAWVLLCVLLGLAFVIHAAGDAPTNGLLLSRGHSGYVADPASAGPGESVAIVGLAVAGVGLLLGLARAPSIPEP